MGKKVYILILATVISLANTVFALGENLPKLTVFHSPSCHKCIEVKREVIPQIEKEFEGNIEIEYKDISDIENYKMLLGLRDKYKSSIDIVLPVFFMGGSFLNGKDDLEGNLSKFVNASLNKSTGANEFSEIDFISKFKSFVPLAIVAAGFQDGINPCAFTVIVFFISFLALQGYRKKELIFIGFSFIVAVFITYLLIGIGIFNFLYNLKGFWIVVRLVNFSVGILSIALGFLALYDFIKFRKTKDTQGLLLQLPKSIKNRIHSVIGQHYRKQGNREGQSKKFGIVKLVSSAFITGFLVSLLEAVCTGQLYLPTIAFVLKTSTLKLEALGYLLLYNFLFVLPLLIVFLFALLGVTSEQFSRILKNNLLFIKILMALMFFGLGIFLIWRG